MKVLLVPGGLWEPQMTADRFWEQTGVAAGLRALGHETVLFDRTYDAPSWTYDVPAVLARLGRSGAPAAIMAGSNGCSLAALVALAAPERVARLILGWPASAHDPEVDGSVRTGLSRRGVPQPTIEALLGGETLRGSLDTQLRAIMNDCWVIPSVPENRGHQRRTWERLVELGAEPLVGCPEPPSPGFAHHLERLLGEVDRALS